MRYDDAAWLLERMVSSDDFADFLTEPEYDFVAGAKEVVPVAA